MNQSGQTAVQKVPDSKWDEKAQKALIKKGEGTPINEAVEAALVGGDMSGLSTPNRVLYYKRVCETVGLNPFTKPFDYLSLNGKLVLYANKNCAEQLRELHKVSITDLRASVVDTILTVVASATNGQGRSDVSTAAVPFSHLRGNDRANAIMKAETKAKRRVTLSLCGMGMLDETELATIPDARTVPPDWNPEPKAEIPAQAQTQRKSDAEGAAEDVLLNERAERTRIIKEIAEVAAVWNTSQDGSWKDFMVKHVGVTNGTMNLDQLRILSEAIVDKLAAQTPAAESEPQVEPEPEPDPAPAMEPLPADQPEPTEPAKLLMYHQRRIGWDAFNKILYAKFPGKTPDAMSDEDMKALAEELKQEPDGIIKKGLDKKGEAEVQAD